MATKYQAVKLEFNEAVKRLEEVMKEKKNEFIRDSAIKRFELAFDLSWKAIKAFLEEQGVTCSSPMSCFKEAYRQGVLEYKDVWISMVETRNKTVHTYDMKLAEEVYSTLPKALEAFQKLSLILENKHMRRFVSF